MIMKLRTQMTRITTPLIRVVVLGLASSLASAAVAQPYSIDWHTIDGGGGTSTGGVYSLSGTIGQHDAGGSMTGGDFSLAGGFWSIEVVQTPGGPLLKIVRTAANTIAVS